MKTLNLTDDEFEILKQALYDRADMLRQNVELNQVSKEDARLLIDDALRLRGKLDEL